MRIIFTFLSTKRAQRSAARTFVRSAERAARCALLLCAALCGQTSTETWVSTPRALAIADLDKLIDTATAVLYKSAAAQLIRETVGTNAGNAYFVIHVVRWRDANVVDKQNWYVFHQGAYQSSWNDAQFSSQNRIYGRNAIWFLYLHLNAASTENVTYTIQTAKKVPVYIDHLRSAGGLFGVQALKTDTPASAQNIWDARQIAIPYVPSNVTIAPKFAGGSARTFDDEGLYRIDFSAAVPLSKTTSQEFFGLADFYFKPIDIKTAWFSAWPHLVAGVRVGSRPLDRVLIGVGYGPVIAHVYAGVVLDRTMAGQVRREVSFGLNISIGASLNAARK